MTEGKNEKKRGVGGGKGEETTFQITPAILPVMVKLELSDFPQNKKKGLLFETDPTSDLQ